MDRRSLWAFNYTNISPMSQLLTSSRRALSINPGCCNLQLNGLAPSLHLALFGCSSTVLRLVSPTGCRANALILAIPSLMPNAHTLEGFMTWYVSAIVFPCLVTNSMSPGRHCSVLYSILRSTT